MLGSSSLNPHTGPKAPAESFQEPKSPRTSSDAPLDHSLCCHAASNTLRSAYRRRSMPGHYEEKRAAWSKDSNHDRGFWRPQELVTVAAHQVSGPLESATQDALLVSLHSFFLCANSGRIVSRVGLAFFMQYTP